MMTVSYSGLSLKGPTEMRHGSIAFQRMKR